MHVTLISIAFIMVVITGVIAWRNAVVHKNTKMAKAATFVPVSLCLIFIVCCISACNNAPKAKVFEPAALKKEASLMSHYFLKHKLKVPATAKYPVNESRDVTYFERDSIFFVDSYLDAKNAYGALLRESFFAKMKYKGKGKWTCLRIEVIEQ